MSLDNSVFQESLSFLQKADKTGTSLYDHLADVLLKVLEHKPDNALNNFENLSFEVKHSKSTTPNAPTNKQVPQQDNTQNKQIISLFKTSHQAVSESEFPEDDELPNDGEFPDLLEEANILEWAGVGIGKEETYRIMLSMKFLLEKNPLKSVRLFGKILGTKRDYYVCEAQYKDGEGELDEQEEAENVNAAKKEASIPSEEFVGTNKHTYWVCNKPGDEWVKLPNVTPAQISTARKISKFFTGDLDANVISYPPFPGKEASLLRAQLARITAATSISPKGFYGFEEEDDVQDDSNLILADPEYQSLSTQLLLEPSNWVHHAEHILPQGRCTYFRVRRRNEDGEEEEGGEEGEEGEEDYDEEEERGPRLLTEITEDKPLGKVSSWSARLSTTHSRKFAYAYVRSNRWPGAYAISYGNKYANIYVGFGTKYSVDPFTPSLLPPPQAEPENEPKESIDPTLEEEKELERMLHAEDGDQEGEQTEQEGEDMGEEEEDYEDEEYQ
eukprot:TRINITY_DN5842_c0_g1_i1.p1 TRINITY_DN5842_c0_g1~~TRINITY_DN5842_c0_g1_i1.p1  ORF type:complete len:551 (-),score=159.63 TRINITY_DN5842_c0_g1_i1:322-1821(-)